jgi:hypothetical protein
MNNADLAEIRALLQASTPPERARKPLFGPLRALLPVGSKPAHRRPAGPPPRRVGIRPAEPAEADPVEELFVPPEDDALLLTEAAEEPRRRAFGQRQEAAAEPVGRLRLTALPAPEPQGDPADDAAVAELLRRRSLRLGGPPAETPYHPEDLSDTVEGRTEELYAEAGLFEAEEVPPDAVEVEADVAEAAAAAEMPETPAAPDRFEDERETLERLERMFLAEQQALAGLIV